MKVCAHRRQRNRKRHLVRPGWPGDLLKQREMCEPWLLSTAPTEEGQTDKRSMTSGNLGGRDLWLALEFSVREGEQLARKGERSQDGSHPVARGSLATAL